MVHIGILQALAGIVPVIGYINMDGSRFEIRLRLAKPIMPFYRFLSGMLVGQRVFRKIGLNLIMMVGIRYQIVI